MKIVFTDKYFWQYIFVDFSNAAEVCDATGAAQSAAAGTIKKSLALLQRFFRVPRTGFEPAHPCGRCDLNTVRLPISPSGHSGLQM